MTSLLSSQGRKNCFHVCRPSMESSDFSPVYPRQARKELGFENTDMQVSSRVGLKVDNETVSKRDIQPRIQDIKKKDKNPKFSSIRMSNKQKKSAIAKQI